MSALPGKDQAYTDLAEQQMNYILGDGTGNRYVVVFGTMR